MQKLIDGKLMTVEEACKENEKLIYKYAHRLNVRVPFQDLVNEGFVALVEAYHNFDDTKGIQFNTYGGRCAYLKMLRLLNSWTIGYHYPHGIRELSIKIRRIDPQLERDIKELAKELNATPHRVKSAVDYIVNRTGASLEAEFKVGSKSQTLASIFPVNDDFTSPFVLEYMALLDEEEIRVLKMLLDEMDMVEIAKSTGSTREKVRNIRDNLQMKMYYYKRGLPVGGFSGITEQMMMEPDFFNTLTDKQKNAVLERVGAVVKTNKTKKEMYETLNSIKHARRNFVIWHATK